MDVFFNPYTLAAAALGYLLGSIPFGYLLTRAAGLGDVRDVGSGNIGATNVLRTGHKGLAALTLLLDALKGTAAVLLGHWIGAQGGVAILASLLAGLAAFLGHVFPVWLGFRGGKGVATYIGVLLGVDWRAAARLLRRVAAGRRRDALFLAVGARRRGHHSHRPVCARRPPDGAARGDPVGAPHLQAPRQHPSSRRRRGAEDRCQSVIQRRLHRYPMPSASRQ